MAISTSSSRYRGRKITSVAGTIACMVALLFALVPLGAMLAWVLGQGGSSLDLNFLTHLPVPTGETGGGMLNAITGTLLIVVLANLVGLPVGIGSGIYLSRTGTHAFSRAVRFFMDVIAGTPSIVAGIVAYALLVVPLHSFSAFSGAVALAILMFPTVGRATEEAIRLVPVSIREGAFALGIPEWKTMLRITLPAASTGIITAVMLGIARVAGETAPLLFTAFGNPAVTFSPGSPVETLPLQIWTYATSPYEDWHRQAWAGAFLLFLIIVVLNLSARVLTRRMSSQVGRG